MDYKDYYDTLGLKKEASPEDIKKQYRRLARKYHPDVSKEENAEEKFKAVKEAYEVLKDPEKRKAYDQLGSGWQGGQSGFEPPPGWEFHQQNRNESQEGFQGNPDFSDFFESIFGGQRQTGGRHHGFQQRGDDQHSKVGITLEQAYRGEQITLQLQSAAINPKTGQVEHQQRQLNIKIPKGIQNGQQIRLAGQGNPGIGGAPAGDLFIEVSIKAHPHYTLEGRDIFLNLPITPWEAALGATISVPTLAGSVNLKIPPHSQTGQKLRLKGRGLPGKTSGDQFAVLTVHIPEPKNTDQEKLYQTMADTMPFNPRQHLQGI